MKLKIAIEEAIQSHSNLGGVWHVVMIGNGYYDVSQYWMDLPRNSDVVSEFQVGTIDEIPERKISVVGKIITKFNQFLLWLFKPLIDGRRNKGNT